MDEFSMFLEQARAGDSAAKAQLFRIAGQVLNTVPISIPKPVQQRFSGSDVRQISFHKVIERLATFNGTSRAEFEAWVRVVAKNTLADELRRITALGRDPGREQALAAPLVADTSTPSRAMMRKERILRLMEVIETLPKDQALALRLIYLSHMAIPDVAEIMGKTESVVAGLVKRGMAKMRKRRKRMES